MALYGACALVAQLALLQELFIVFAGYELFLGFSLASWMGWVGLGSRLAARKPARCLAPLVSWLVPLFIANLVLVRLSKCLFGFGMLAGLVPMLALTVILLAPIGLAIGACFTWGCEWASHRGLSLGAAYRSETIGASVGGILYSWIFAGRLSPDGIIVLLALPTACLAAGLSSQRRMRIGLAASVAAAAIAWGMSPLPRWTRALQWQGYTLLADHASRYSHLALARTGSLTSLFDNGLLSVHFPDPMAYEELVHWPLLAHPAPRRVLVIGTAATGTLAEVLKHPITDVDYVELDPAVVALLRPVLDPADRSALNDPRVHLIHEDGRRWLRHTRATYDVILLQLPEPRNAQINRLYTLEAFRAMSQRLPPSGIVAFTIPSSENYLSPATAYFNACLYRTVQAAFPSVELIAGDPLLLMAGRTTLSLDVTSLIARYDARRLVTREVVPSYLPIKLEADRRASLLEQLQAVRPVLVNRDFFPICYAYAWRVWISKFVSPVCFLGTLALLALAAWVLRATWRRRGALRRAPGTTTLFLLGGAAMLYETILLLAFQSINGYIYWQLGTLFAAFMLGLALGSGLVVHRLPSLDPQRAHRWLRGLVFAAGIEGTALLWILPGLQRLPLLLPPLAPFGLLLILTACWLGAAFPLAARLAPAQALTRTAGTLYAADLWGASLGAVVSSSVLIPLIGLGATASATGLALLAAFAVLPVHSHAD